ncbi:MAG: hypothetical protein ABR548_14555 [Actinomycetota bacterium]|nr:hypothetical protein [Actinomycetota bacterium]
MKKLFLAAGIAVASLAMVVPAHAATQTIDANLSGALSMTTSPTATISSWSLASSGANTTSGGSVVMNANQPYTVGVTADKTRMTEYASGAYVSSSPKTLTSPMTITAVRSAGTAVSAGVGAAAIVGTSTLLATGTGLGTDTYDITLAQPTAITDQALSTGSYHIVLTYTASSTL